MRLLLAEDERSLARAVGTLLERSHYAVDVVHDGAEALALACRWLQPLSPATGGKLRPYLPTHTSWTWLCCCLWRNRLLWDAIRVSATV